ncbi:MAG TPA: PilZ domain-containing protein [Symbiobacteriaceae bacterium]
MDLPHVKQHLILTPVRGIVRQSYLTHVEHVGPGEVVVEHPLAGTRPVPLRPGDVVRIEYMVSGRGIVRGLAQVVRLENRGIPVVVLKPDQEGTLEPVQRRQFVRLDVSLPLTYTIVRWAQDPLREGETYRSRTRDISAGGAQILCPEPYPVGTQLDVDLELPGKVVHLLAEVVRLAEPAPSGEYWVAVRFLSPDESTQQAIIRYIFDEERQRRRKGLM